ncbi:MAG: dethiobiotin synthase [Planctomycetes bacterium]|nr:dethiobiotin synthase [Planctomycetota bacterium]
MSLVVVGTDTDVGKTVVSSVLLARYGRRFPLAYWKPIATGAADGTDSARVRRWVGHRVDVLPETYLFEPPVSPHLAARLAGVAIEPDRILEDLVAHGMADERRGLVIEGIGGLLVPINDHGYLLAHLLEEMQLPCLLVARSTLGTINHTLLALEALRRRRIALAGAVLCGPLNRENRRAVQRFGGVEVIGEVDRLPRLGRRTIEAAARRFDRSARLRQYFE